MHISSQPGVICQIPPGMIRIVVNHDRVARPQPIVAVFHVKRRDTESEAAKPESRRPTSRQMEFVTTTEAAWEASVLKRPVQMKARVVCGEVMAHPRIVGMDVRPVGMPRLIGKVLPLLRSLYALLGCLPALLWGVLALLGLVLLRPTRRGSLRSRRRRAMLGNVSATYRGRRAAAFFFFPLLRESRQG